MSHSSNIFGIRVPYWKFLDSLGLLYSRESLSAVDY